MNGENNYQGEKSSSKGCFFWGCITVVFLFVLVAGGIGSVVYLGYSGSTKITNTSHSFLESLRGGQYEEAYNLLTPSHRESTTSEEFAAIQSETFESLTDCSESRLTSLNIQKDKTLSTAEAGYQMQCSDGPVTIIITLNKIDKEWLIQAFEIDSSLPKDPSLCPNCGHSIALGANFCSSCGEGLK